MSVLELSSFKLIDKGVGGQQCILAFGDTHQLSIISGKGAYGNKVAPYEAAIFINGEFAHLPGINQTIEDDVIGYLTEDDVDAIIKKMYFLTGKTPRQV